MASDPMLIAAWTTRSIAVGAIVFLLVLLAGVVLWKKDLLKKRKGIVGAALRVLRILAQCCVFRVPAFSRVPWARNLTRHPFTKYVVLSVIAHVVLAIWAYTARLLEFPQLPPGPSAVIVELGEELADANENESRPWDEPPTRPLPAPDPAKEPVDELEQVDRPQLLASEDNGADSMRASLESVVPDEPAPQPSRALPTKPLTPADIVEAEPQIVETTPALPPQAETSPDRSSSAQTFQHPPTLAEEPTPLEDAQALSDQDEAPTVAKTRPESDPPSIAETVMTSAPAAPTRLATPPLQPVTSPWGKGGSQMPIRKAAEHRQAGSHPIPTIYRDRQAEDRLSIARARGGSVETEAAVRGALVWLATNQSADGRWDASRYGSGQATADAARDRQRAGLNADTGITGLAVLAFLGAGHTHQDGDYQPTIRNGISYLLQAQQRRSDGSLVGSAGGFAAMYCHGIATLALSECYALTGDPSLLDPVRRAVAFSLAAQHPVTGGWRYQPQQPGDTSQLGWQLMALTSAHYGGMQIPRTTWTGAGRFLNSVAWGNHNGLASYRPGERPSTAMTAEALLCRLFLGVPPTHPLIDEGASYLSNDLPGSGRVNYYYWYYGTLALYHLQDERWSRWNLAVQRELLQRQRTATSLAGSWDADSVWGGSGGRVYTTSLATLTLEVYYRYRPLRQPRQRRPEQTAWNRD